MQRVEFWLQRPFTTFTMKVGEVTASPWELELSSNTVPPGWWWLYARAYDFAGNVAETKWPALPPLWVAIGDVTPPTTALVAPVSGLTMVAGAIRVSADAADPGGALARVELLVDDAPFATLTASPFEAMLDTTTVANGDHVLTSRAYDAAGNTAVSTPVYINVLNPGRLVRSRGWRPCLRHGLLSLPHRDPLMGRGPLGPETNASNTVDGCPDGTEGTYEADESIEHVAISSLDGAALTGGKLARVEVRAYVADPAYDRLDVYVAADPAAPEFVRLATVVPTVGGEQTLSANVPLAYSGRQVVRVALRGGGAAEACGATGYDDRDDVVIATLPGTPDTTSPTVTISSPEANAGVRGPIDVSAAVSDDVGVATSSSASTTSPWAIPFSSASTTWRPSSRPGAPTVWLPGPTS